MHSRFVPIAAAMLMSASVHAADTAKPSIAASAQPQPGSAPAQVVLASAENQHSSASSVQQAPAPKHRIARVTTCRCGDPQSQPEQ